MTTASLTML